MNTKLKKYLALLLAICIAVLSVPLDGAQIASFFAKADVESEEVVDDDDLADFSLVCGPEGKTQEEMEANEEEDEDDTDLITQLIESKTDEEEATEETLTEVEADEEEPDISTTPYDLAYPDEFNSGDVQYASNSLLIKFKKSASTTLTKTFINMGIGKLEAMFEGDDYKWYTAYLLKDADINDVMDKVRALDTVIVAEYNYVYETCADIDDATEVSASEIECIQLNEKIGGQTLLNHCNIAKGWLYLQSKGIDAGGLSSTTVAVIDTGVDYTHKDLMNNMWYNVNEIPDNGIDDDGNGYVDDYYGIDMTAGKGSAQDDNGHGTHVAGIIAATNNDIGIVGIAYNARIMAIKAGDASGYFLQSNIAKAVMYAYDNGADVINMSFGGSESSIAVQDALETAYLRCVLVAAAGNSGLVNEGMSAVAPMYPAAFTYVVGVMSCGFLNIESSFSNYDGSLYSNIEYEVYAPGEQILSTLPGNRYGKLSGTSMAAPVVAAQAALLRAYYTDHNTYPTKFIYGQIVGTADDIVSCCNIPKHGYHNIPGKINFYKSFTKLPNPDLGFSDYTIFDTAGYSADTAGITAGCETINNGDGIVDAGETIALGFTIKNRWGMSKDTVVSITATNDLGVTSPYVTILNNDLDYGSVGTYSENDSGKITTDEQWTGWQNPFYIKIADNCPNNYTITLNISLTSKNALDEEDDTVYTASTKVVLVVRRGVILPSVINEDTTLTNDNYYILSNSMLVAEGATLTIEKGTKIQFWCSDSEDAYADTGIAYIKVNGTLITNGTEDEPVEMFPSDWMDRYRVEIYAVDKGRVYLNNTNIVNPYLTITEANNCEFTQTYYRSELLGKELVDGNIRTRSDVATLKGTFNYCAFYKLGSSTSKISGFNHNCAFIDSACKFTGEYDNCLFYGNNNNEKGSSGSSKSSYTETYKKTTFEIGKIFTNTETGESYLTINFDNNDGYDSLKYLYYYAEKKLGFKRIIFETEDEYNFVLSKITDECVYLGSKKEDVISYDWESVSYPSELNKQYYEEIFVIDKKLEVLLNGNSGTQFRTTGCLLFEIPTSVFVQTISFDDQIVNIDLDNTYTINPIVTPIYAQEEQLIYESLDDSVAIVDANGKVTPVSQGSTQIKVSAPDRGVYNYVTVNVKPAIDLCSIEVSNLDTNEINIGVGETKKLNISYVPLNTTKKNVSFSSSNEDIVMVDENGNISAVSVGDATITIIGANDVSTSILVHSIIPTESISFTNNSYVTDLTDETIDADKKALKLEISPSDATNKEIVWTSTNSDVAYVNAEGVLIKVKEGSTSITATVKGTNVNDSIMVNVTDKYEASTIKKVVANYEDNCIYALTEVGNVFYWGGSVTIPKSASLTGVKDIAPARYGGFYYIDANNNLCKYYSGKNYTYGLTDIKCFSESCYYSTYPFFAIANDGTIWAWGINSYGQLGAGTTSDEIWESKAVQTNFESDIDIVKIVTAREYTLFLSSNGDVYISGTENKITTPTKISENAKDIYADIQYANIVMEDSIIRVKANGTMQEIQDKSGKGALYSFDRYYYIEDGIYYSSSDNETFKALDALNDVKDVFAKFSDTTFLITESGKLYGFGSGSNYRFGNDNTNSSSTPIMIDIDSAMYSSTLEPISTNIINLSDSNYLISESIDIAYNLNIFNGNQILYMTLKDSQGNSMGFSREIENNHLIIKPKQSFEENQEYTLTIPAKSFITSCGDYNEQYTITFTHVEESVDIENEIYTIDVDSDPINITSTVVAVGDYVLDWTTSDETIAYVNEEGKLVAAGDGIAKITATITGKGVSDSCYVAVGEQKVVLTPSNISDGIVDQQKLIFESNLPISNGDSITSVAISTVDSEPITCTASVDGTMVTIVPSEELVENVQYTLTVPASALTTSTSNVNDEYNLTFTLKYAPLTVDSTNFNDWILNENNIKLTFDFDLTSLVGENIVLATKEGNLIESTVAIEGNTLTIIPTNGFMDAQWYKLSVLADAVAANGSKLQGSIEYSFIYEDINVIHQTVVDENIESNRTYTNIELANEIWQNYLGSNESMQFFDNAIINRLNNDDVNSWLRIQAPSSDSYLNLSFGHNYWGTTNETLINKQVVDFDDYQSLADVDTSQYLTTAPSDTFPFVVDAYLEVAGEEVDTVGNQEVKFVVEFNRDMDTTENIEVAFGSAYPYRDYEVEGAFVSSTRWEGTITLTTLIENGYQYWSISGGRSAALEDGSHLKHYEDWGRFPFKIDTSSALSLTMQANATDTGIELKWTQDDYETLAGYNVYRSTSEDGLYTKLNTTVIPADVDRWFDDTVEPGVTYYYNFTVVETDATTDDPGESEPSGKVVCQAKDTMAPNIYHSPVTSAYMGSNLVINATITDNLAVSSATLYYRTKGADTWTKATMTNSNDKYSAIIYSTDITLDGIEYYIDAYDGISHTYKGTADSPYEITVQAALDKNSMGDVDGNGKIELKDAIMLLMAVNDRINLTEEQFARADLDGSKDLSAAEALKIIMYVNGSLSTLVNA